MAVDPAVRKKQLREGQKRWRQRHRGEWKHRALRVMARKQAEEEGVDRWVVYRRWGIDVSYLQWAAQKCQPTRTSSTLTSSLGAPSI